jgi:hypothetical protein
MRRLAIAISLCLTSPAAAEDGAPTCQSIQRLSPYR